MIPQYTKRSDQIKLKKCNIENMRVFLIELIEKILSGILLEAFSGR